MSEATGAPAATSTAVGAVKRAPHLYEVDILRILTFICVIGVHTTSHTVAAGNFWLYGLLSLLHFTREVFFSLTGFVLIYSYLSKPVSMKKFWPKRFLLVGVPYLLWSVIYFAASNLQSPHGTFWDALGRLATHILTGTAWYHLYFLLVTMQVYLLVPLIVWLVRKTRGHHVTLLVVFGVLQLALFAVYMYQPHWIPWKSTYNKEFFFSYAFFIILGAVCADHATGFLGWVRSHRRLIGLITLLGAVATIGVFLIQHALGYSLYRAGTPLQPITVIWSMTIALGFLAIGTWWADRRDPTTRFAKAVDWGSDRSFGVYLSHPLVLWILLMVGGDWLPNTVAKPWLTLVAYLLVILGAVIITEIARRTPLSLAFTGRPYKRKKPTPPPASSPAAVPPS